MPVRIAIAGAGRMGQAIAAQIRTRNELELVGLWRRGDDLAGLVAAADAVIDFSLPDATETVVDAVLKHRTPLVCGVSGLDDRQYAAVRAAGEAVPVVYDRNMSQGITALRGALELLIGTLGDEFSVRLEETHHVHKKDRPSGTALALAEVVARMREQNVEDLDIRSERRGEVPGDHTVILESETETLTLTHSVTTRDVFARGAIRAAIWLAAGRSAGLYSMADVLFGDD